MQLIADQRLARSTCFTVKIADITHTVNRGDSFGLLEPAPDPWVGFEQPEIHPYKHQVKQDEAHSGTLWVSMHTMFRRSLRCPAYHMFAPLSIPY